MRSAPRFVATALGGILLGLAPGDAWSQPCWGSPHMMWGGGWFAMALGQAFTFVILATLVALVVLAARRAGGKARDRAPIDILKERFARGEIDKAEFEDRRRTLGD